MDYVPVELFSQLETMSSALLPHLACDSGIQAHRTRVEMQTMRHNNSPPTSHRRIRSMNLG